MPQLITILFFQLLRPAFFISPLSLLFRNKPFSLSSQLHHISPGPFQMFLPGVPSLPNFRIFSTYRHSKPLKHVSSFCSSIENHLMAWHLRQNPLSEPQVPHYLAPSDLISPHLPGSLCCSHTSSFQAHNHLKPFAFAISSASHFIPSLGRFLTSFRSFLQSFLLNAAFLFLKFPLRWHNLFSFLLSTCFFRFPPSVYCCIRSAESDAWYRKDAQ